MAVIHAELPEFHTLVGGAALKPFAFETIYGHYFDRVIAKDGKAVLEASVARYVAAVEGKRGYE